MIVVCHETLLDGSKQGRWLLSPIDNRTALMQPGCCMATTALLDCAVAVALPGSRQHAYLLCSLGAMLTGPLLEQHMGAEDWEVCWKCL
jgi:hypothetical protein